MKKKVKEKVVYILGAGFSMAAGAPSQANIIKEILQLEDLNIRADRKLLVTQWVKNLKDFLKTGLNVSDVEMINYTLEDIYTPLDKCISENLSFRSYSVEKLIQLRDEFNKLIILAVRNAIEASAKDRTVINEFAKYLVEQAKRRVSKENFDFVAVLTTNWDIMLDNASHNLMFEGITTKPESYGVLDYCCYISSIDEDAEKIKPGLYALGKGGYNLKLLKLHGSLNWLQCPQCNRLYVKYFRTWNGGYVFARKHCRHCKRNFRQLGGPSNRLKTNLVMPTFLKNLNNVQHKLIWQNAGIELSEASKVVFMGYSLPSADFEFKQLLSRMIRSNAKIEVILHTNDNPLYALDDTSMYQTAGYRYMNFFSGRSLSISYDGVGPYVESLKYGNYEFEYVF